MIEGISNKSLNTACVDGGLLYKVTFTQIDNEDNAFTRFTRRQRWRRSGWICTGYVVFVLSGGAMRCDADGIIGGMKNEHYA